VGLFLSGGRVIPAVASPRQQVARAVAFFDGQNLFHAAKGAFGYRYPNYDALKLAREICRRQGWVLTQARFYTGVPEVADDAFWHEFWMAKLAQMGRQGVHVYKRSLKYRTQTLLTANGDEQTIRVGQEKGIDMRIGLDVVRLAHQSAYEVALLFSQDQDLSEVADEIRMIAREQRRFIKIASAFPASPAYPNTRGINKTDWIRFDRETYAACIDSRDYRPKRDS
jgi:uncharacterized LabA/DUF88 family protein